MALFRLGSVVPTPGVDYAAVQRCIAQTKDNALYGLINLFSGGALLQLSVFALGIMPYITASIIVQLLTVVIPRFEALKKEGQAGHRQAHAVHPLPHHRAGDPAVDRPDRAGARTPGRLFQGCSAQHHPERLDLRSSSRWSSP